MANVIKPQIMHDHRGPVIHLELFRDVSGYIVIYLNKILKKNEKIYLA